MPRPTSLLHDYQKRAITRMIREPEMGLFLDMGLGKTAISLFAIRRLIDTGVIRNCLILGPIRVVHSVWRQEAAQWDYTKDLTFTILHGSEKDGRYVNTNDVYLCNYEGIQWLSNKMRRDLSRRMRKFDMVIFDESTKMKSPKTKRFKQLKGLVRQFKRRYILTATPVPNHLQDLWSQMYIMDAGKTLGTAFGTFQRKYFYEAFRYNWVAHDHTKTELQNLIRPKVMRLKASDYLQLPEITYNSIQAEMPPKLYEQYKELEEEFFLEIEEQEVEVFNAASLSMKLRQFVQGAMYYGEGAENYLTVHDFKLKILEDLIDSLSGAPVIIPIQFRFEREILLKKYPKAKVIAGGTSVHDANLYIEQWNRGELEILFCNPVSMAHGVNLQAGGHHMIWYGLTWSLENYLQLVGRIYRQGQKNGVVVHHIVMRGTVDEAVMKAIRDKGETQEDLLNAMKEYRS